VSVEFQSKLRGLEFRFRVGVDVLQVSVLHYSTRSWISEGVRTVASAHVLCQPTIAHPSIL